MRASLVGDIFQRKRNKIFKELSNVFGILDDILAAQYDKDWVYQDVHYLEDSKYAKQKLKN